MRKAKFCEEGPDFSVLPPKQMMPDEISRQNAVLPKALTDAPTIGLYGYFLPVQAFFTDMCMKK